MVEKLRVLLAVMAVAALADAGSSSVSAGDATGSTPRRFKDLPGVVPQEERVQKDAYRCTADIADVTVSRGRFDILYGDTMPRRVYRCETESGLTYTGTRLPNPHWIPGLNPLHLPR